VHLVQADLDKWLELHGYVDTADHLARFVRRNAMRQMRWLDRALRGDLKADPQSGPYDQRDDEDGGSYEHEGSPPRVPPHTPDLERSATSIESPQGGSSDEFPAPPVGQPPSAIPPPSLAPSGFTPSSPHTPTGHSAPASAPPLPFPGEAQTTRAPVARPRPHATDVPSQAPSPGTGQAPTSPRGNTGPKRGKRGASAVPAQAQPPRPRRARAETATVVAHRPRDLHQPLGAEGAPVVPRAEGESASRVASGEAITTQQQALSPDFRRSLEEIHEQAVEASRRSRSAAEDASGAARVAEAAARRARDEGERADAMQRAVQRAAEAIELHMKGDVRRARAAMTEARDLATHTMSDEAVRDGRR